MPGAGAGWFSFAHLVQKTLLSQNTIGLNNLGFMDVLYTPLSFCIRNKALFYGVSKVFHRCSYVFLLFPNVSDVFPGFRLDFPRTKKVNPGPGQFFLLRNSGVRFVIFVVVVVVVVVVL